MKKGVGPSCYQLPPTVEYKTAGDRHSHAHGHYLLFSLFPLANISSKCPWGERASSLGALLPVTHQLNPSIHFSPIPPTPKPQHPTK